MIMMMIELSRLGKKLFFHENCLELTKLSDFVSSTHNNEMCNVMAEYSYEAKNEQQINARVPLESCWGNLFPHLIA